jgi:RHS repeat-associated protein
MAPPGKWNGYKYSGKELQKEMGLNWGDHGVRMADYTVGRWWVPDPLAGEYYSFSPYVYCNNNPIKYIDPDGREPRIYVETKGFGHAFVTVGTGDKTVVYTYGRYGELGKNKSSARGTTPTGEGVLIKLTGDKAKSFIQDQITNKEAVVFEFTKGSDEAVAKHFDNKLNSSDKTPTIGDYAGNENAKVVDKYNVLTNNCVTTSVEGVQSGSEQDLKLDGLKGPMALRDVLNVQSGEKESNVIKISVEEIKKELKLPKNE